MTGRGHDTIDHAADMGVEGWGSSMEEAFEEVALGVLDLIAETRELGGSRDHALSVRGEDPEGLLVSFLNEMISLSDVEEIIFTAVEVKDIEKDGSGWRMGASLRSVKRYGNEDALLADVKAVARFGAKVSPAEEGGWTARCLVDL